MRGGLEAKADTRATWRHLTLFWGVLSSSGGVSAPPSLRVQVPAEASSVTDTATTTEATAHGHLLDVNVRTPDSEV